MCSYLHCQKFKISIRDGYMQIMCDSDGGPNQIQNGKNGCLKCTFNLLNINMGKPFLFGKINLNCDSYKKCALIIIL